jgi:hypothetical protein
MFAGNSAGVPVRERNNRVTMSTFYFQTSCEFDRDYSLKIEDDGRVAYAYMYWGEDIIGDVWLYNQLDAPKDAKWHEQEMPYLNPAEYLIKDSSITPLKDAGEIRCEWTETKDGLIEVDILLHGKFIAQLAAGAKPGWSALVVKDGPLAQVY